MDRKKSAIGKLKRASALSLAFLLPAAGFTQTEKPENVVPGHSYWKYSSSSIIIDLWPCPQTGLCGKIHAFDPAEKGAIEAAMFMWQRDAKKHLVVGGKVSHAEIMQMCGKPSVFRAMHRDGDSDGIGHWRGIEMYHALKDKEGDPGTANEVDIRQDGDKLTVTAQVHATLRKFGVSIPLGVHNETVQLDAVKDPPPACVPPRPHPEFH